MRITMRCYIIGMLGFLTLSVYQASGEAPAVTQVSQEVIGFTSLNTLKLVSMAWGMAALGHGVGIREAGPMLGASVLVTLLAGPRMSGRYERVEMDRMRAMDVM